MTSNFVPSTLVYLYSDSLISNAYCFRFFPVPAYCAFQEHANSEVQNLIKQQLRLSLRSITVADLLENNVSETTDHDRNSQGSQIVLKHSGFGKIVFKRFSSRQRR